MTFESLGHFARFAIFTGCLLGGILSASGADGGEVMEWARLPSIPDAEGFAGAFAGVSNGALIVAGGANIEGDKWAEPLRKQWYDSAFVLEKPDGEWRGGFRLPRALGYGVSVTTERGLVCIGGSDSERHHAECFLLEWRDGRIVSSPLPALPKPCANMCGVLAGTVIYVAGGIEKPDATTALKTFWKLDLAAAEPRWEALEPWPGPERMLAVAGVMGDSFYLFSGAKLRPGADGKPVREYLRDAYRFTPGAGWTRVADLPRAAVAAASPAPHSAGSTLMIISGDDGSKVDFKPVKEHPGFPRDILHYSELGHARVSGWSAGPDAPFSRATVPVVRWRDRDVFVNGEARPRVRTPEVWALEWKPRK